MKDLEVDSISINGDLFTIKTYVKLPTKELNKSGFYVSIALTDGWLTVDFTKDNLKTEASASKECVFCENDATILGRLSRSPKPVDDTSNKRTMHVCTNCVTSIKKKGRTKYEKLRGDVASLPPNLKTTHINFPRIIFDETWVDPTVDGPFIPAIGIYTEDSSDLQIFRFVFVEMYNGVPFWVLADREHLLDSSEDENCRVCESDAAHQLPLFREDSSLRLSYWDHYCKDCINNLEDLTTNFLEDCSEIHADVVAHNL